MANESPKKIKHIDKHIVQSLLKEGVRGTVEETLNAMLDAEADRLCNAGKYERTEGRRIPVPVTTQGILMSPQGGYSSGYRSCETFRSRRPSSNDTNVGKHPPAKHLLRCTLTVSS